MGYNGWKNYETWCMALWIDNDSGTHEEARELAREAVSDVADGEGNRYVDEPARRAAFLLADRLKDLWDERNPVTAASVWSDLLSAAFSEIDWEEIASHFIDDAAEELRA